MIRRITLLALLAVAPLHAAEPRLSGHVAGDFVWELKLSDGTTARWNTSQGRAGSVAQGKSHWFRNGAPLGPARDVSVFVGAGHYVAEVALTDDETMRAQAARETTPEIEGVREKHNTLIDKRIDECGTGADEKPGCGAKYDAKMDALGKQLSSMEEAIEKKAQAVSAVCTRLKLRIERGVVSGTGERCAGQANIKVSGTLTSVSARAS